MDPKGIHGQGFEIHKLLECYDLLLKKWAVNSRLNVLCAHFFTFYTGKSSLLCEVIA